jgi:uncharacterized membrane protein (UPF0182 family)
MLFSLFGGNDARKTSDFQRPMRFFRWWIVLVLVLAFAPRALTLYTDSLWFDTLGYAANFWFVLRAKWLLFFGFLFVTWAILRGAFAWLERVFEPFALGGSIKRFDGEPLDLAPEKFMRPLGWGVSIVWALLVAATMTARWPLWALFLNQAASDERDPIFHKPLSFYLFSWPVWEMIVSWLAGLSALIFLAACLWALCAYISRLQRDAQERARRAAYLATALALAGVLLCWTARLYVERFSLLWKGDDIYNGIGYVGAHVTLPTYLLLMGVLVLCALVAIANALRARNLKVFVACLLAPIAVSLLSSGAEAYVSNFVVKPNQLALETPYIKNNIAATRRAFALDRIAVRDFPAEGSVQAIQAAARTKSTRSAHTLSNIRLWDWKALQDTLTQTQTLRTYYEFPDVDVDRYVINGRLRQVMIAARELDTSRLPESSRNWVNQRLIYTHGYGVVMNTASEFTPEGRPRFIVSEMPLRSSAPEIKITRPEIYFGQESSGHVYVKTNQKEFNYTRGGKDDSYSTYAGNGGIALGSGLRRWALAWSLGDLTKIPFSDAITPQTRVLLNRQIQQRVLRIAPFLQLDRDPYIVAAPDGKLYWMLDAYTTSLYYPYSTHDLLGQTWANYARNSVKIVIDAYEGTTDFYVFEPRDPVIQTWRKIFPALFKDAAQMPKGLRAHVRYPETLFRTQSEVYGLYHTEDVSAFFSRNDLWSVARLEERNAAPGGFSAPNPNAPGMPFMPPTASGRATTAFPNQTAFGGDSESYIEPYFLLTQLPDQHSGEEFVLSAPFTPNGRPLNLSGWLAARSDGDNYGRLALYNIAESRNISAPQQVLSRITQDAELSKLINLWNQQKSNILWGNFLVIPLGRGLLYVQPIFLQSTSSPLPELRMVVLATQDKIFYAPTYEEVLKKLLGDNAPEPFTAPATEGAEGTSTPPAPSAQRTRLIERAARNLADYQSLTAQGKYGEAGQKLEALKRDLETLRKMK